MQRQRLADAGQHARVIREVGGAKDVVADLVREDFDWITGEAQSAYLLQIDDDLMIAEADGGERRGELLLGCVGGGFAEERLAQLNVGAPSIESGGPG